MRGEPVQPLTFVGVISAISVHVSMAFTVHYVVDYAMGPYGNSIGILRISEAMA